MKSGLQTAGFLLLFLFVFVFFLSSCESRIAQDRFAYTKKNIEVEISGKIDGEQIRATLHSNAGAENQEIKVSLRFTCPKSLDGITVALLANGDCSARLHDTAVHTEGLEGLIEPFRPVFEAGDVFSVKKNSDGSEDVRVYDENCDITYRFVNDSDIPLLVRGECCGKKLDLLISLPSGAD